jgi:hypothetical protein
VFPLVGEIMMHAIEELRAKRGLMDAKPMAEILGMHLDVLYRKSKEGLIPHFRILGRVKYDPQVITDWLEERRFGNPLISVAPRPRG